MNFREMIKVKRALFIMISYDLANLPALSGLLQLFYRLY